MTGVRTICCLALVLISGCAAVQPSETVVFHLTVTTDHEANPNRQGRPSPVLVQVIGVEDLETFFSVPLVEIERSARDALSGGVDGAPATAVIAPGMQAEIEATLRRETRWAGLVAQVFASDAFDRCVVDQSRLREATVALTASGWRVLPADDEGIVLCRTEVR